MKKILFFHCLDLNFVFSGDSKWTVDLYLGRNEQVIEKTQTRDLWNNFMMKSTHACPLYFGKKSSYLNIFSEKISFWKGGHFSSRAVKVLEVHTTARRK